MQRELFCLEPATPARLEVRTNPVPRPGSGQVLVRVEATSVNPIDVKRAAGYGRRILGLKGAGQFPLVLGNDVGGVVEAVGKGVTGLRDGARVLGLLGTGRGGGAHATYALVPQGQLIALPAGADVKSSAALPYSFTTMWLAVRSTGLTAFSAQGAQVLVNGASGGLGQLALQLLAHWGSRVTAVCGASSLEACRLSGAEHVVERGPGRIEQLAADFDAVLNFGAWEDEPALASRLAATALGHATAVHPLLSNFDRFGWLGGAMACRRDWRAVQSAVRARSQQARYSWTVFRPDREALDMLAAGVNERRFSLPVGLTTDLDGGSRAFEHVAAQRPGRALILPSG